MKSLSLEKKKKKKKCGESGIFPALIVSKFPLGSGCVPCRLKAISPQHPTTLRGVANLTKN